MVMLEYNKNNSEKAKILRKNMTKEEKKLWYQFLNKLPVVFRRQKAIGDYIVDFYCTKAKLVIELDGSQHYDGEQEAYDRKRDKYLNGLGLTVVRYSNLEISRNFEAICADILNRLQLE